MPKQQVRPYSRPTRHAGQPTGRKSSLLGSFFFALFVLGAGIFIYKGGLIQGSLDEETNADNDAAAIFARALACYAGSGFLQDKRMAADGFRKAAELGHADAQYRLGRMYAEGDGLPRDMAQAAHWFRKAAEQGETDAQYRLGLMYAEGDGLPQDTAQALEWLRKAGDGGAAEAWYRLSVMYNSGLGLPRQKEMSQDSLRKRLRKDRAEHSYEEGMRKYTGKDTLMDPEGGLRLLREAASLGHPKASEVLKNKALERIISRAYSGDVEAMIRLASRYFQGKDMPPDRKAALGWYRHAAKRGSATAQYILGVAHYEGVDLAKNLEKARYLLEKAARQGHADAAAALDRFRREHAREYEEAASSLKFFEAYDLLEQRARNGDMQARRILERLSSTW